MKIAVSGKGGVGKTTVSSLIVRELVHRGRRVLAIDADPNGGLAEALGYDRHRLGPIVPLIERRSLIEERTGAAPGQSGGYFVLNPQVDDFMARFSIEVNGVPVMVMGGLKEALTGCYCSENAVLRSFLRHLMVDRDEWVLLDMEAGFEHLTRGTAQSVDLLLIVVEPGERSINTAKKLNDLANHAGIPETYFIANKLHDDREFALVSERLDKSRILLSMPYDHEAVQADLAGEVPYASCPKLVGLVAGLVDQLESIVGQREKKRH